jgi:aminoglycoside phosphotransferase (APT) family kinase protein
MPQWDAEIEVDEALARALIRGRYPHLDSRSLRLLGIGWDNTVWATGDGIAFRFPRREIALAGIEREIALLPRIRLAEDLGSFLRCLHGLTFRGLDELPLDPMGRADMSVRVPRTRAALDELDPALSARGAEILGAAESLPMAIESVFVHGDLHLRHVLIDRAGRLRGVIDWGDICRAPAAVDLSVYWSLFPPAAREAFCAAYGAMSQATLLRARVLALFLNAMLALYARDQGLRSLEVESLRGVERALAD